MTNPRKKVPIIDTPKGKAPDTSKYPHRKGRQQGETANRVNIRKRIRK